MINQVHASLAITRFLSDHAEAMDDMKRALANAEAIDDDYTAAIVAQALGDGYTRLADFALAERYLNTALDYYRRNEMKPYLVRGLQSLVVWYEQQGRGEEAEQAREEARRLMKDLSLPPHRLLIVDPPPTTESESAGPIAE